MHKILYFEYWFLTICKICLLFLIDLLFTDPPSGIPRITTEKSNLFFYESDTIIARCEIEDGVPSANMTLEFKPLTLKKAISVLENNVLSINLSVTANRTMDQNKLVCKVNHFAWLENQEKVTETDNFTLYSKFKPIITAQINFQFQHLNVKYIYIIVDPPGSPTLYTVNDTWLENRTYSVYCISEEGRPESSYRWTLNGREIKDEHRHQINIRANQNQLNAQLVCNVYNNYTLTKMTSVAASVSLKVKRKFQLISDKQKTIMDRSMALLQLW